MSFIENLNWRYATKKFDSAKKVSVENKAKILNAIRMAPSWYGVQPFHVTVVEDATLRDELKKSAYGQSQVADSSFILVFSARTDLVSRVDEYFKIASGGNTEVRASMKGYEDGMRGSMTQNEANNPVDWAGKQAYLALGFGLAACAELKIDACPMGGFDPSAFKKILNLPENHFPQVIIAVGYRLENDEASKRLKVRFPEADLFDNR